MPAKGKVVDGVKEVEILGLEDDGMEDMWRSSNEIFETDPNSELVMIFVFVLE